MQVVRRFWANCPMAPIKPGNILSMQYSLGQSPRCISYEAVCVQYVDLSIEMEEGRVLCFEIS
jgi:hypothetical protein